MRKIFTLFVAALCCAVMTSATEGALPGKFSVAADKQVYFSQGNLRATPDECTHLVWSFAENQYDFVGFGDANNAISGNGKISTNGFVDLFGWSGKAYYGVYNSRIDADYSGDFNEWGQNAIINGGNEANLWRTLTQDEWVYLFQTREDASSKYGAAKVNDEPGIVLLPDDWTLPSGCGFTAGMTSASDWSDWSLVASTNIYDGSKWWVMEAAGAVFLPAAGYREGTSVSGNDYGGFYWSSTPDDPASAHGIYFHAATFKATAFPRHYGLSVRLVIDVDPAEGIENNATPTDKARKVMMDGTLYIATPDGSIYDAQGSKVK